MTDDSQGSDIVFVGSTPVEWRLDDIDLDELRSGFSHLFDQAAEAVHAAGLDLDDVFVERSLLCRTPCEENLIVGARFLADRDRLISGVTTELREMVGQVVESTKTIVTKLQVSVLRDRSA